MPQWFHVIFGAIWLFTAIAFACLAYSAHQAEYTSLARFSVDNPKDVQAFIEGIDIGQTLNEMSETNNRNITMLEDSIRQTSQLAFVLNTISCVAAIAGFFVPAKYRVI